MKKILLFTILTFSTLAFAKDRVYQSGQLDEMNSVDCGYEEKSGKGFKGMLLGTDAENRKVQRTLCQEYVLRTAKVMYRIRPAKDKHKELLPIGEAVNFRLKKDKLLLQSPSSEKEIEYIVVSMQANDEAKVASR